MPPNTSNSFDCERFLAEPIFAMDFQIMLGDLKDFLDSSERSIEQMYQIECERVRDAEGGPENLPGGYREHLQLNADHRFRVSLPLRVRYGALIGMTTSVDWAIANLKKNLRQGLPGKPRWRNATVHTLSELNARTGIDEKELVVDYEALVQVRNCVVHAAGIVRDYKRQPNLHSAIDRLEGFRIGMWHFLGEHVCIDRGALNHYIDGTSRLVVGLHKKCYEHDLLKK